MVPLARVVLVQELEPELELVVLSTPTASNFCVTTHNSSSYDRWYNSSRKCLSRSFSKLVQETHSWHR